MDVRRAELRDAAAIAAIHVAASRAAYRGIIPTAILDAFTIERRATQWTRILGNADSRTRVWVAEDIDVIGFASTGPSAVANAPPATAELYTLYLEPSRIGAGVGKELETAALEDLRDRSFHTVTLWVLEANSRARGFYEHR